MPLSVIAAVPGKHDRMPDRTSDGAGLALVNTASSHVDEKTLRKLKLHRALAGANAHVYTAR